VETADHVLLVTVPDTVGVARACETLEGLAVAVPRERLGVMLNRYRKGEHDAPDEVAAREFLRFADRIRTTQAPAAERWWRRWLPIGLRARGGH
jgi:hypothetical protein